MKYFFCIFAIILFPQVVFSMPNDPRAEQWGYAVTQVYDAWNMTTGSENVVVAVIDNGFDHYHADLIENIWHNKYEIPKNGIDDDNNGYIDDIVGWNFVPEDKNGNGIFDPDEFAGNNDPRPQVDDLEGERRNIIHHGTLVAGIIGAKGNNGVYGAGLNWDVSLMNLKIVGNDGNGSLTQLARAIRYAVDNGADIISMSVIGALTPDDSKLVNEAVMYAHDHDVVLVAAAGNTATNLNDQPLYPVCSDAGAVTTTVIGTSAVMEGRKFAVFSNYGSDCIDITAPGHEIASTLRYAPNSGLDRAYDGGYQGTSFAVPFVSGAAALIRSIRPDLTADQVIESILHTTSKTPPDDETLYANLFGRGLLQIADALRYAETFPKVVDTRKISALYEGVAYTFKNGIFVEKETIPPNYTMGTSQVALSGDTDTVQVMVGDRTYTWNPTELSTIESVFIDVSEKSGRIVAIDTSGKIGWFTIDGYAIRTIDTGHLLHASYLSDTLEIITVNLKNELQQLTFDRNGQVVSQIGSTVPGTAVSAGQQIDSNERYILTRVGVKEFALYVLDTFGNSTYLFSYTAKSNTVAVRAVSPDTLVLFDNNIGTVYTTTGTQLSTFSLE